MRRSRILTVALAFRLVGLSVPAGAQTAAPQSRLEAQVNLVRVLASVLDRNGRAVLDLPVSAFHVFEDGVPQKIERFEAETNQPLDLALMIDSSMSTVKDLRFEREAAARFLRAVVHPGDSAAVFEFDDRVTQLSEFSDDVPALEAAALRIELGAGTALYDAIVLGSQALKKRPPRRRRATVLVTDAGETTSVSSFEDARRAAVASDALLYSIVIRPIKSESGRNTAGEHALATITDVTGGAMYFPDELTQLDAMFERIDRELRTQYFLGYYPKPQPPPASYRQIELRVDAGYTVRYRKGYFTVGTPR